MNKEQLIAKCKEIEPTWSIRFFTHETNEESIYFCNTDFFGDIEISLYKGNDNIEIDFMQKETVHICDFNIQLLDLARQYFKENEMSDKLTNKDIGNLISDNKIMKEALEIIASDGKGQFNWTPTKCWYFAENTLKSLTPQTHQTK